MLKYVFALYFFVCSIHLFPNKPYHLTTKGYIVSFSRPADAGVMDEVTRFRLAGFEALNPERTIFRIAYHPETTGDAEALHLIRLLPFVQVVQEDGPVYPRNSTPNDTLFSSQWYMGMISANKAWDSARGGVNRAGDTIVVAIVDDGLHINHPDFKGNIWINYADIPGNGIDDDSNGFKDDHYGWNFMGRNNDISDSTNYAAKHGSWVSGVIGARGNDVTGISGIMWNVKLMFANIADTGSTAGANFAFQSDVIRAYSYVLHQRKLYNATNGQKGAFVVAINSSWGVDLRKADQAPVWCAFYDSLGKAGILTAGATANSPTHVESQGDLPSLCTSKHLIMVTSVNSNDQDAGRGYGTTSIDLSAPGEGIFTTNSYTRFHISTPNGLYGTFSGTSAATPMVTGAIGLLHAFACQKMTDLIKSDPERANLLMRRFILDGVDTLPALVGKNATTGRLNIYKAMQIMDEYCYGTLNLKVPGVLQKIVIYPNPGNGLLTIESFDPVKQVDCFDMTGKAVLLSWEGNKVDIAAMAEGVYVFRIETTKGIVTLPYVKND